MVLHGNVTLKVFSYVQENDFKPLVNVPFYIWPVNTWTQLLATLTTWEKSRAVFRHPAWRNSGFHQNFFTSCFHLKLLWPMCKSLHSSRLTCLLVQYADSKQSHTYSSCALSVTLVTLLPIQLVTNALTYSYPYVRGKALLWNMTQITAQNVSRVTVMVLWFLFWVYTMTTLCGRGGLSMVLQ